MKSKSINQLLLASLLTLFGASAVRAQSPLTLNLSDKDGTGAYFDGNVFGIGNQYGDASINAQFSGNGTRSFTIYSPGELRDKTITSNGFFTIRPTGDMTVDKTLIKNFSGSVTGSVKIKIVRMTIYTYTSSPDGDIYPGTRVTTRYGITSTGTFPQGMGFKVQLFTEGGTYIRDLLDPADQTNSSENTGYTNGGARFIQSTIPTDQSPGNYRVRVVITGLNSSAETYYGPVFTIKSNASITVGNVSNDVCQGSTLSVPFTYNGTSSASPYNIILIDANTGGTVVYLSTSASSSPTTVQIPGNLSGKYKVTVRSTYFPNIPANSSNEFTIRAKPTLTLSNTQGGVTFDGNVFRGGTASIAANANSDSPWSMNYFDPESGQMRAFPDPSQGQGTSVSGQKFFYPNPVASGAYGASNISGFKNQYCDGTVSGSVNINVKAMAITTGNPDPAVLCGGATIKLPMTTNGPGAFRAKDRGAVFVVQLLDNNGGYLRDLPTGGGFGDNFSGGGATFTADVPGDLPNGQYKTRVFFKNGNPDVTGSASGNLTVSRAIVPTVTKPEPVCQGSGSVQLQATGPGTLRWFDFAGTPLSGAPVQPAQRAGDYGYFVSQNINGCESDRVSVVVVIKPTSSPPGDASREFCQNESPQTLTTNAQNPIWYEANGTTQLPSAPAPPTGTATTLTYKLSQDTNGCRSGQSTITVRVKPLPAAPTFTPPDALCQFGPTRRLTASGDGLRWYRADGSLIGTDAPEPGLGSVATQTYQVSQTKEGCEGPKAKIDQPFKASPAKPGTTPVSYCVNQVAVSLTATGQSLTWYQNGTKLSEAPKPPTTQDQTLTYEVTQTENGCESERNSLVVRVLAAPGKPTVKPVGLCVGQTPASLTASVTADGPLKWYDDATTPTGQATPKVPPVTQTGSQAYFVTQTVGNCEGPRAQLDVTVYPIPTAPTFTAPAPVCELNPQPVGPFVATGQNKKWTFLGQAGPSDLPPTTATAAPGTFTVAVTQTVDGCTSPQAIIAQTINPAPVKPAVTPLLLCRADPQTPVSATALPGHKLNWYGQSETGGTASPASPTITTGTTLNTNYYVSQTLESTSCESLRQAVSVVVADAPPAPSVNAVQQVCLNTTPTALTAGGNGLFWTASAGGGLTSPTVNPVPPTTTAATYSYTVVQRLGTCVGPASTITFTVRPLPAAPAVKPLQVACINDPSFALSATALTGNKLTWYDTQQRTNPQPSVTIQTGTAGTKNWFVTQTDNIGCESPVSPQTSRVLAKATARLYGDEEVYFFDSTAVRIQFGGEGPWTFTLWNDKTITNNLTNPLVVWVPPTTVTRTYELKALSNECGPGTPSNKYEVRIINRPVVTAVDPGLPDASLMAYPNPASADVRVSWRAASRSSVVLRVLSLTGSVVWQVERTATGAEQTELVPAGLWAAGVYTLQLQTGNTNALESRLLKL